MILHAALHAAPIIRLTVTRYQYFNTYVRYIRNVTTRHGVPTYIVWTRRFCFNYRLVSPVALRYRGMTGHYNRINYKVPRPVCRSCILFFIYCLNNVLMLMYIIQCTHYTHYDIVDILINLSLHRFCVSISKRLLLIHISY